MVAPVAQVPRMKATVQNVFECYNSSIMYERSRFLVMFIKTTCNLDAMINSSIVDDVFHIVDSTEPDVVRLIVLNLEN